MPNVFILEEPKHGIDVKPASVYGNLVHIFNTEDRRPSVFKPNEFGAHVLRRMEGMKFNPDEDFFLLTGSLVCISVALGCLMSTFPRINLLMFSSVESKYVMRRLDAIELMQTKEMI